MLVVVPAGGPTVRAHGATVRIGGARRAIAASLLPPCALVGLTALYFLSELTGGPIAYGRDTTAFYYPLTEWMASELKAGRLPLWIPLIFGGYPLLADGEVGPLYPPNLLLFGTLPFAAAYAWMRALHYAVAALGLFALARSLRIGGLGAFVGGLAFAYGSFMVGHLQHDNILRSAAWLPWLLLAAERALRARGPTRPLWIVAGALVLALQNLGVHIQPVLLSVLALGAYLAAGPLIPGRPTGRPSRAWLLARLQIGAGIVGLGFALAGAQLVPLYALGQQSLRPSLMTYDYATSYAVSPPQILTLIFPYMFHFDAERSWALWSPHETTLYVGVAPLLLAVVAIGFIRSRAALFFGAAALLSLILCLGDYLPIKPYTAIWNLPGFAYLRAPARFSLLFELAVACLAALGVDWLGRRARAQAVPRALVALLLGLPMLAAGLALALQGMRWWLQRDPSPAIEAFRILLQTSRENWLLGPWHVYYGLMELARPSNVRTLSGLLLLGGIPLLLWAWTRRPRLAPIWGTVLAGIVILDLWAFAAAFHFQARPDRFPPESPAVGYLASQPGPFRVFVEPALNQPLGPNQLVSMGLASVNGYSSLEPRRFSEYRWSLVAQDNFLLDLLNVRYVLAARRVPGQRTYQGVSYHPSDRLLSGAAGNPSGTEEFRVPTVRTASVTIVSAVEGLADPAPETAVAELTLVGAAGESRVLSLRAGIDVGEHHAAEPGRPTAEYTGPPVVWAGPAFTPNGTGPPVRLYGTTLAVDPPIDVVGATVRVLAPAGRLHVHGIGLGAEDGTVHSIRPSDRAKYQPLYEDRDVILLENWAARPRVWVAAGAVPRQDDVPIVDQMLGQRWDPDREIVIEGGPTTAAGEASGTEEPTGQAELLTDEPSRVSARADLAAPGYLVLADRYDDGWRAWSEGRELPILRADGIFRAVALPAGSHLVTFVYDPWWLKLGFAISALGLLAAVALLVRSAFMATRHGRNGS